MNTITDWFTPARRRRIYDVAASVLGLFTVLLPVLVSSGVIEQSTATQVLNVGSGVLGVIAAVLARVNVPATPVSTVPE